MAGRHRAVDLPRKVTALAGGTGAAKLLRGLVGAAAGAVGAAAGAVGADLTVIVNTGDDTDVWGLHVSPDLDSVMYALAGRERVGLYAWRGGTALWTFREK